MEAGGMMLNLSACHSREGGNPAPRNTLKAFPAQTRLVLDSRLRGNDSLSAGNHFAGGA